MSIRILPGLLLVFVLAATALAATPGIEQFHQLLLKQQQQLQAQDARIKAQTVRIEQQRALIGEHAQRIQALKQNVADHESLVAAQQRTLLAQGTRSMEQGQVVAHLEQKAVSAQAELDLVLAMMAQGAAAGTPGKAGQNPYLDQAGPMTASLAPAQALNESADQEPELPFTITAGVEHLKAYSDSFTYIQSEWDRKDEGSAERNQDTGYKVGLAYKTLSGITWGAGYHYWAEQQHSHTAYTANSVIALGPTYLDANNIKGTVDAERWYADLSARGALAGSSDWSLDLLGGLRGGSFSQSIYAYNINNLAFWADSHTSYLGYGPMAGLALDWNPWERLGLHVYMDTAMLMGESETDCYSRDSGANYYHRNNSQQMDVVWMTAGRLGLDYGLPIGDTLLAVELGLNAEHWTGLPDHVRMGDDVNEVGVYGDTDVLLMGPYFDVNWSF